LPSSVRSEAPICQIPKLIVRVRFSSPAPLCKPKSAGTPDMVVCRVGVQMTAEVTRSIERMSDRPDMSPATRQRNSQPWPQQDPQRRRHRSIMECTVTDSVCSNCCSAPLIASVARGPVACSESRQPLGHTDDEVPQRDDSASRAGGRGSGVYGPGTSPPVRLTSGLS